MEDIKQQLSQKASLIVWSFLLLFISGSLLLFAQFIGELKSWRFVGQGIEFRNTITVSGEGEIAVVPDVAEFSFAVIEEAREVAIAQENVTKKMNTILDFLDEFGVDEKNVKTTNYNLVPRYAYRESDKSGFLPPPRGERILVGYEVSHWVTVKITKIDRVGEALAEMGTLGASNVGSVRFTIEDEDAANAQARKLAIKDAKEKARVLAKDLNVRLVKITSFSEGGRVTPYRAFALAESLTLDVGGAPTPQIPVGENQIISNITITYAIK